VRVGGRHLFNCYDLSGAGRTEGECFSDLNRKFPPRA